MFSACIRWSCTVTNGITATITHSSTLSSKILPTSPFYTSIVGREFSRINHSTWGLSSGLYTVWNRPEWTASVNSNTSLKFHVPLTYLLKRHTRVSILLLHSAMNISRFFSPSLPKKWIKLRAVFLSCMLSRRRSFFFLSGLPMLYFQMANSHTNVA